MTKMFLELFLSPLLMFSPRFYNHTPCCPKFKICHHKSVQFIWKSALHNLSALLISRLNLLSFVLASYRRHSKRTSWHKALTLSISYKSFKNRTQTLKFKYLQTHLNISPGWCWCVMLPQVNVRGSSYLRADLCNCNCCHWALCLFCHQQNLALLSLCWLWPTHVTKNYVCEHSLPQSIRAA